MVLKHKLPYPLALAAGSVLLMASWQLWVILSKPTSESLLFRAQKRDNEQVSEFNCRKIDTSSPLVNTARGRMLFYGLTGNEKKKSETAGDGVVCLAKQRKADKK